MGSGLVSVPPAWHFSPGLWVTQQLWAGGWMQPPPPRPTLEPLLLWYLDYWGGGVASYKRIPSRPGGRQVLQPPRTLHLELTLQQSLLLGALDLDLSDPVWLSLA